MKRLTFSLGIALGAAIILACAVVALMPPSLNATLVAACTVLAIVLAPFAAPAKAREPRYFPERFVGYRLRSLLMGATACALLALGGCATPWGPEARGNADYGYKVSIDPEGKITTCEVRIDSGRVVQGNASIEACGPGGQLKVNAAGGIQQGADRSSDPVRFLAAIQQFTAGVPVIVTPTAPAPAAAIPAPGLPASAAPALPLGTPPLKPGVIPQTVTPPKT